MYRWNWSRLRISSGIESSYPKLPLNFSSKQVPLAVNTEVIIRARRSRNSAAREMYLNNDARVRAPA